MTKEDFRSAVKPHFHISHHALGLLYAGSLVSLRVHSDKSARRANSAVLLTMAVYLLPA